MADPRVVPQYDIPARQDHLAIFDADFRQDISLYQEHDHVQTLEATLGDRVVGRKVGVGVHSPYRDVVDIAHLLQDTDADGLITIGSSSDSDAGKVASKLANTLRPRFTEADVGAIVDQAKGHATTNAARVRVIQAPTSLSAAEWNGTASATNADGKKQHFGLANHRDAPPT
ncbi:maleylacetate reductase [Teratosphaeria destructans]|uniref:Maleylacetate reductase n=1 Tax=Teratosphaeria destructans TaxID=418781 RepID=A0A9W7SQ83_9PEZI|nr:maleylacetate reductase [Teratosphaeria destructans]